MFNWLTQKLENKRIKQQQHRQLQSDLEVANKYITKRSEKKAFETDMGIKTKAQKKRTIIPKSIEISGVFFEKYTSYESDLDSAKEAAEDMRALGYKTKVETFYRGSNPIYVLYRYKRGMPGGATTKPKTKPVAALKPKTAKPKKKCAPKKKVANSDWYFC